MTAYVRRSQKGLSETEEKVSGNMRIKQKCALCVSKNSLQLTPELELIIRVWADLDDEFKQPILKMISKEIQK